MPEIKIIAQASRVQAEIIDISVFVLFSMADHFRKIMQIRWLKVSG